MAIPTDRSYSETHEWFLPSADIVTMGITQYAADALTDITYIELPEVGTHVTAGENVGEVESVKATSDVLTAVSGEIIEVNIELVDHPELINDDAFEEGWLVRIRADSQGSLGALMDAKEYESFLENAG